MNHIESLNLSRLGLLAAISLILLGVVPAVFGAPGDGIGSGSVEELPPRLPEMTFALLSAVALFAIYVRGRIRRVRSMHEPI